MSHDQAAHLRTMMYRTHRHHPNSVPPPRLIAVSAGRTGVGATTLGVNLAIALAQHGQRTVIVDADLSRADVAAVCGVTAPAGIADVLAGRRSIHEVLQRGPGGIQLAAGATSPQCRTLCTDRSIGRLLSQIRNLGRHTDAVVIDAGSTPSDLTSRIWQAADCVLVVTTPEAVAVMDAYALIKSLSAGKQHACRLELVINQVESETVANDVHGRVDRSCRRFLGLGIALSGWVPVASRQTIAAATLSPWLLQQPPPSVVQNIEQIAARLLSGQDDPVHEAA